MTDRRRLQLKPIDQVTNLDWEIKLDDPDYFDVKRIVILFSGPVAVDENLTITLKSHFGAAYDTVLKSVSPVGGSSVIIEDINNLTLDDSLLLEFANTGGLTMNAYAVMERAKQHTSGVVTTGTIYLDGIVISEPLIVAGYDKTNDVLKVMEDNALSLHFTDPVVLRIGPIVQGVPDVSVMIDMEGYRGVVAALYFVSGTGDTVVWKMESAPDGSLAGSKWKDTTQFGWTSATEANKASYAADGILYSVNGFRPPGHRFSVDTTGGTPTNDNLYDLVYTKWW